MVTNYSSHFRQTTPLPSKIEDDFWQPECHETTLGVVCCVAFCSLKHFFSILVTLAGTLNLTPDVYAYLQPALVDSLINGL